MNELSWDSRVNANDIKVEVQKDMVKLTGTVPTFLNKKVAADVAYDVRGVKKIQNELGVKFPTSFRKPTDKEIQESVDKMMDLDNAVDKKNIKIEVKDGVVTLSGSVPTFWEKSRAENDATVSMGVKKVINKIAVVPTKSFVDKMIGEAIMNRIKNDTEADVNKIDLKVKDGNVTLSGKVKNRYRWKSVYDSTKSTLGVKAIKDDLEITWSN